MLKQLIPQSIKFYLLRRIRTLVGQLYIPSFSGQEEYSFEVSSASFQTDGKTDLPVPPQELWAGYGPDSQAYLESGRIHVDRMVQVFSGGGFDVTQAKRILEFGCAAGRMVRHLPVIAPAAECWGTDISSKHIQWCRHHLTPPMHFAVTTTVPHLPFEDRFFDAIFCGSVFTHIEDLEQAWLLELGRVLAPAGRLYITIHDEHTVRLLDTKFRDYPFAQALSEHSLYARAKQRFSMIVLGRSDWSNVFYHSDYFRSIVPPLFRWVSHTPEAYGYQSAVVLEKLAL